ncbi:hypothetical protein FEM48_Zijuj10G0001000 [Ziziphus jujuba var. spinosa]|uniref:Protein HAPLESS 2-like n=1 Tax=Ziziphus jujuba var. spinosa TaxID=714518 RepID=A0A978UK39_ZIZJJ|nr:hypothetical protein FEM48_Zijuj10G0001000 [Ziziphus jujuba var. spinosa]
MGTVISKAANGVGGVLGNAFVAPFKTMFGGTCEGVCSGPWDIVCFIEHLCVSSLLKLLMILVLCYITLLFFYILFKVGICQCIGRSLCKLCWAACEAYWYAVEDITCFLWHKLKNTKRINRRRRHRHFEDMEQGYSSSDESAFADNYHHLNNVSRKYNIIRRRRKGSSFISFSGYGSHGRHHHARLKSREVGIYVKGGYRRPRSSRQLQISKMRNVRREARNFKRRRLR